MGRKIDDTRHVLNPIEAAKAVARALEASVRHQPAADRELFRRLEAAVRCGALFSGAGGAEWGRA